MNNIIPEFSIVIPVYNEQENIPELYKRLTEVMDKLCASRKLSADYYEIIMVDDGSTDDSWNIIKNLHHNDRRVKGINFSRNFGHHIAITAGLDYVKGRTVILMDGDLQDPPEEIPKLYERFQEGFDLVYGIRQKRNDSLFKILTSKLFWWILRKFSGVEMPKDQTMLRILSKRLVESVRQMRESARFVHGIMAWVGFNSTNVEIRHNPRNKGKSKYNLPKMFKLAFHAVTSFSAIPLKLASYLGFMSSFLSFMIGLYFLYKKLFLNIPVPGYASIIVSVFFVGGIQLLVLGIMGEYIGRTYHEVQHRPLYIIKESFFEE
ncbi:MAG: glycosyltransferase family 2 protein [Nitrospirae bacterium]|jgi:dolichol-phosphate mannosyltransferase|nr:glycosyltransferase family 2 protein [Nitrospirota bacterium]